VVMSKNPSNASNPPVLFPLLIGRKFKFNAVI
jgi:hypothetical protein